MYQAIFRLGEAVDASQLYEEFANWPNAKLNPIYQGNSDWTGICVYRRPDIDCLGELPALKALVSRIGARHVTGINYFNLAPKSVLHRHRDMYGNLLFGVSRIHIPIKTNPEAIMEVEKRPYHLGLNEIWCLDTSGLHALRNESDANRVHIVIDVKRHPETEKYFPPWSPAVMLHLGKFILIVSFKVLRDVITRPRTIINRVKGLKAQFRS